MPYTLNAVDYFGGTPNYDDFVTAGITTVLQYTKNDNLAQKCADIRAHGMNVAFIYEGYGDAAHINGAMGTNDGNRAGTVLRGLGVPVNAIVYFAVDFDANLSQISGQVNDYYLAARAAITPFGYVARMYGGIKVIDWFGQTYGDYGWQTYAWSGGNVSSYAALLQYDNGQSLGGITVDFNTYINGDHMAVWKPDGTIGTASGAGTIQPPTPPPGPPGQWNQGQLIKNVSSVTRVESNWNNTLIVYTTEYPHGYVFVRSTGNIWIPQTSPTDPGTSDGGPGPNGPMGPGPLPGDPSIPMDLQNVWNAFATDMKNNSNSVPLPSPSSYVFNIPRNGCTTLVAWFLVRFTDLAAGLPHGKDVVNYLCGQDSSMGPTTTPSPISVFSVAAGVAAWGASGGVYGHTGLVFDFDGSTAATLATGSGYANTGNRGWSARYPCPHSGVTFANLGGHVHA